MKIMSSHKYSSEDKLSAVVRIFPSTGWDSATSKVHANHTESQREDLVYLCVRQKHICSGGVLFWRSDSRVEYVVTRVPSWSSQKKEEKLPKAKHKVGTRRWDELSPQCLLMRVWQQRWAEQKKKKTQLMHFGFHCGQATHGNLRVVPFAPVKWNNVWSQSASCTGRKKYVFNSLFA